MLYGKIELTKTMNLDTLKENLNIVFKYNIFFVQ